MWLKGNLHAHSNASDGDAPPEAVADWYAAHGYDFLALTDHNKVTVPSRAPIVVLPSTEISLAAEGKPAHVNALGVAPGMRVLVDRTESIGDALQRAVDATREAGGVPMLNHPNFRWAFDDAVMARVNGWSLLEIHNTSTECNSLGGGGRAGVESMWDRLLTSGRRVFAVASDDAHDYTKDPRTHVSPPGLAWVHVDAAHRSASAILAALEAGDFYASTEVVLDDVVAADGGLHVAIRAAYDYAYTTEFIGAGGVVLATRHGLEASYALRAGEPYVRARVRSSNGGVAWTQPLFAVSV